MLMQFADLSMNHEQKKKNTDICHQFCDHGGQRWIADGAVVGFDPETKTVYQHHGCHWHGCIVCFTGARQRKTIVRENITY